MADKDPLPETLLGAARPRPYVEDAGGNAEASARAPFIYFDVAHIGSLQSDGVGGVTLEAIRHMPGGVGRPIKDFVVVAHLRMGLDAVRGLRKALEELERLSQPVPGAVPN